jgi:Leucine-rich repeat (LRR) protein
MQNQIDSSFAELRRSDSQKRSSRKKYIIPVVILLLIIALFISFLKWKPIPNPSDEEEILEAAAKQLNKKPDDFTEEDFTKITELTLGAEDLTADRGNVYIHIELSDLNLLKKFTNLKKLSLFGIHNPKSAIPKWMMFLANHGIVNLDKKFEVDLSPLKKLTNLEELELSFIPIRNIKPLSSLTNLKHLRISNTISYTQISNMPYEEGVIEPHGVSRSEECVIDISPLHKLSNIEQLYIWNTIIKNIKPLAGLINMEELNLSNTNVSDLRPLSGLINLQMLRLYDTNVSDLEPLKGLINLNELDLQVTKISDLEPLKQLKQLITIRLRGSKNITEKQAIDLRKYLPNLEYYDKLE